jgi:hypothetical protein
MTSSASSLIMSVMSSIDDLKDKITDGEYLNLCNLLKSLNEEIKEKKEVQPSRNQISNIEGEIIQFLNDNSHDEDGNQLTNSAIFLRFNEFLEELEQRYVDEDGNYIEEQEYFMCPCGCSVRTSSISEHIEDEFHGLSFLNP